MIVNRTVAVFTLVGGTAQKFTWPSSADIAGSDGSDFILRNKFAQLVVNNSTAITTMKFQFNNSNDVDASATVFDVVLPISTAWFIADFAIPVGSTGVSIFSSAAVTSAILSVGTPD